MICQTDKLFEKGLDEYEAEGMRKHGRYEFWNRESESIHRTTLEPTGV